jgi:hypothetical protein
MTQVASSSPAVLTLHLRAHGLKRHGPLGEASLYVDCRTMREHVPRDASDWFVKANATALEQHLALICRAIDLIPERRQGKPGGPYAKPFTITCICAYAKTRSKLTRDWLYDELKARYPHAVIQYV